VKRRGAAGRTRPRQPGPQLWRRAEISSALKRRGESAGGWKGRLAGARVRRRHGAPASAACPGLAVSPSRARPLRHAKQRCTRPRASRAAPPRGYPRGTRIPPFGRLATRCATSSSGALSGATPAEGHSCGGGRAGRARGGACSTIPGQSLRVLHSHDMRSASRWSHVMHPLRLLLENEVHLSGRQH
jgi:hypothetical protein